MTNDEVQALKLAFGELAGEVRNLCDDVAELKAEQRFTTKVVYGLLGVGATLAAIGGALATGILGR